MTSVHDILNKQPILLYDGDCGFCNRSIKFFIERDKKKSVHFLSLNSEKSKILHDYFEIDPNIDTMILIRNYSVFIKSCAALRTFGYMKGLWPLMQLFLIIPPFLRHPVYDFIASRRRKFLGKYNVCEVLDAETMKRFID